MLYKVKAKIDKLKMKAFFTALTDGSIADQEPEGSYIVNAMQRALMTDPVRHRLNMKEKRSMINTSMTLKPLWSMKKKMT